MKLYFRDNIEWFQPITGLENEPRGSILTGWVVVSQKLVMVSGSLINITIRFSEPSIKIKNVEKVIISFRKFIHLLGSTGIDVSHKF